MDENNPRAKADITPREWDAWEWAEVTRGEDVGPMFIRAKPRGHMTFSDALARCAEAMGYEVCEHCREITDKMPSLPMGRP